MEVFLTLSEQRREDALFSPREASYPLPGQMVDLLTLVLELSEAEFVQQQPLSC